MYWATAIDPSWLDTKQRTALTFDEETQRVKATYQDHYQDLVLRERPAPLPKDHTVGELLYQHALPVLDKLLALEEDSEVSYSASIGSRSTPTGARTPLTRSLSFESLLHRECIGAHSTSCAQSVEAGNPRRVDVRSATTARYAGPRTATRAKRQPSTHSLRQGGASCTQR